MNMPICINEYNILDKCTYRRRIYFCCLLLAACLALTACTTPKPLPQSDNTVVYVACGAQVEVAIEPAEINNESQASPSCDEENSVQEKRDAYIGLAISAMFFFIFPL